MAVLNASRVAAAFAGAVALIATVYYVLVWRGRMPEERAASAAAADRTPSLATAHIDLPPGDRATLDLVSVRGTVRDMGTSQGVGDAMLVFARERGDSVAVRTNADGHFQVSLAPDRYQALLPEASLSPVDRSVLHILEEIRDLEIRVWRRARVEGRVVDGDGDPLAAVEVSWRRTPDDARDRASAEPVRAFVSAQGTTELTLTDTHGRFTLAVPPGRVELLAHADALPESGTTIEWAEPGAVLTGVEIVMDAGVSLSGRVVDDQGEGVAGATVIGTTDETQLARDALSGPDGRFQLTALAPGRISLSATAPGYASSSMAFVRIEYGQTRDDIRLVVGAEHALAGRVLDEQGVAIEGAAVHATSPVGQGQNVHGTSDRDGSFSFQGLGTQPVLVSASAPGFAPARITGVRAPRSDVVLTMTRAGVVKGRVTDGRGLPLGDFWVRADRSAQARDVGATRPPIPLVGETYRFVSGDGRYQLGDVPPGTYDITFWALGLAPETVRSVVVLPAGETEASASLMLGARVRVAVNDARTGRPVRGASVRLSTGSEAPTGYTDATGRFEVQDVAPGRRSLEVSHPGYVTRYQSGIEVGSDQAVDLTMELEALALGADATVEFAGIGAVLAMEDGALRVRETVPHGPAEVAGLLAGDELTHIDGHPARDRSMADNIEDVRGVVGTVVRLRVARGESVFDRDVIRGTIRFRPDE